MVRIVSSIPYFDRWMPREPQYSSAAALSFLSYLQPEQIARIDLRRGEAMADFKAQWLAQPSLFVWWEGEQKRKRLCSLDYIRLERIVKLTGLTLASK